MNPPNFNKETLTRCKRGAALVITLSMLVLLSFVVVAFFTRTAQENLLENSAVGGQSADLLARSALDIIVADLKSEMLAGSTATTVNGMTILQASTDANLVPSKRLVPASTGSAFRSLVKQSNTSGMFSTAAPLNQNQIAPILISSSSVSSTTPSADGRVVSRTRWDKPELLFGGSFADTQAPLWVLVDRVGIAPSQTWSTTLRDRAPGNDRFVIGRFAYNIYDQGGLLDINVAGHPNVIATKNLGPKGSLGFAGLTSIPGVTDANKFVQNWRNKATGGNEADFLAYLGLGASPNQFSNFGPGSGFLKFATTASGSDNRLLGRQDLIKLAKLPTSDNFGIEATALPYLTHFTREVNAPTWGPTTPTGSLIDYAGIANSSTSANRLLPNVRVKASFTRIDGSSAKIGEPLIKTRFALSKLAWLGKDGPVAPGTAATIQRDFGLSWDNTNLRWNYVGHTGSTVQTAIKTLDEVASDNREPNFFELLKAGILSGSVGKRSMQKTLAGTSSQTLEDDADLQFARIGACLLDQADRDNFPSHIHLAGITQQGIEDLPYLYAILTQERWRHDPWGQYVSDAAALTAAQASGGAPFSISLAFVWIPKLWNPHGPSPETPIAEPHAIRARISAGQLTKIQHQPFNASGNVALLDVAAAKNLPTNSIEITSKDPLDPSKPSNLEVFRPTARPADASIATSSLPSQLNWWNANAGGGGDSYCGFVVHSVSQQTVTIRSLGGSPTGFFANVEVAGASLVLEYRESATAPWRVYDTLAGNPDLPSTTGITTSGFEWAYGVSGFWARAQNNVGTGPQFSAKWDPRSTRWGPCHGWGWGPTEVPQLTGTSGIRRNEPFSQAPADDTPLLFGLWPEGRISSNTAGTFTLVPGDDAIFRPNDAYKGNAANPFRSMTDLTRRPVILQRPFRSVAEMGYAFRDTPWQTLNLFDGTSADAGLLDLFCVSESPSVTAGKVNINSAPVQVIEAVLSSAGKAADGSSPVAAATLAADLVAYRDAQTSKVLLNKDALARFVSSTQNTDSEVIKGRREAAVRGLADVTQTRTWNLLVDLVAQSGRYGAASNTLDKFIVEGERRYWLHVAIDRVTGQVVDSQLELVTE